MTRQSRPDALEAKAAPGGDLAASLRQMLAVLQAERQALAVLDLDALTAAAVTKRNLCEHIEPMGAPALDSECRTLAESARQINEVNRRVRNVLAANVASRLDTLTNGTGLYSAGRKRG